MKKVYILFIGGILVKMTSLKILASIFLTVCLFPVSTVTGATVNECTSELLLSYFPEPFVRETLMENDIPKDKQDAIVQDLKGKDRVVVELVEQKAEKMNPNPLKNPENRMAAIKLFRESLFTVFNDVMQVNGVTDESKIHKMLDTILDKKAKHFAYCMEKHHRKTQNAEENDKTDSSQAK